MLKHITSPAPATRTVTTGLRFPEGPIAMPDGSVILVEIERQTLTRCFPDGSTEVIAETGGGPNGAAMGPDGRIYICNNGGLKWFYGDDGGMRSIAQADNYASGSIQAVDIKTGAVETLYAYCGENQLRGPNDIVFDSQGGMYFTDFGKTRERDWDRTGIYYAKADGSYITEVAYPMITPNGTSLSTDEKTLYVAETWTGRLWAFELELPGVVKPQPWPIPHGGRLVANTSGFRNFDSLAVEAGGNICIATLFDPGITVMTPDGSSVEHIPVPGDPYVTNICFGGTDLRTAFITQSYYGNLLAVDWPRAGLPLNFLNT